MSGQEYTVRKRASVQESTVSKGNYEATLAAVASSCSRKLRISHENDVEGVILNAGTLQLQL